MRHTILAILAAALLLLCACQAPQPTPTPNPLSGGIVATFEVVGERFKVWVTNPTTIQQILDLKAGKSQANIPNGALGRGPGQANHNQPWSWHLDPQDIEMAEMTIELCDGAPWFVESELEYFLDTVKRYCAWSAKLIDVVDYR